MLVVIYHLSQQWLRIGDIPALTVLRSGVDVFFVISGFVMVYSTDRGSRLSPSQFMQRRLLRVVPIYWIVTSITLAFILFAPSLVRSTGTDPLHAIASYLFLPATNPVSGDTFPIVLVGWTLNYEMFFYVTFALAIWLGRNRPAVVMSLVMASLSALVLAGLAFPLPFLLAFFADPVVLEFLFGMAIALTWKGQHSEGRWPWLLLALGAAAVLVLLPDMPNDMRVLRFGIPAAILVFAMVQVRFGVNMLLHRLGDMSYSLYLIHFMVVAAFGRAWSALLPYDHPAIYALFMASGVGVSILAGYLLWALAEVPMTTRARAMLRGKQASNP